MPDRAFIATYIVTNRPYGTLYVGVTANLYRRMYEHVNGLVPGFTSKWALTRLVRFEQFGLISDAIQREKTIKHYVPDWKINLIERENRHWEDLYPGLLANQEHRL